MKPPGQGRGGALEKQELMGRSGLRAAMRAAMLLATTTGLVGRAGGSTKCQLGVRGQIDKVLSEALALPLTPFMNQLVPTRSSRLRPRRRAVPTCIPVCPASRLPNRVWAPRGPGRDHCCPIPTLRPALPLA